MRAAPYVGCVVAIAVAASCARSPQAPAQNDDQANVAPTPVSAAAPVAVASDAGTPPLVTNGQCEIAWLPKGLVTDLPDAQAKSLIEAVGAWAKPRSVRNLMIDSQRGIAYAKSEDDLGGEPPFPRHTDAQGGLACGLQSLWMADSIHDAMTLHAQPSYGGIRCEDNVCCFDGMEFVSGGILVARRVTPPDGEPRWVIDAYAEVAQAALGAQTVQANRAFVAGALARYRAQTCAGEPPGFQ